MDQQILKRINYNEALKQLSIKMGCYEHYIDAYGKFARSIDRKVFDAHVLPWLWANYDIHACPSWKTVPELQPPHWPSAKPLKQPTEPKPAPWNVRDTKEN